MERYTLLVKMQGTGSYVHAPYHYTVGTDKVSVKYIAKVLVLFWEEAQSVSRGQSGIMSSPTQDC